MIKYYLFYCSLSSVRAFLVGGGGSDSKTNSPELPALLVICLQVLIVSKNIE